ncbi:MAG: autotransporter-associated beta strand repeat-containing protein, partial [Planctomycetia bacterium]|nr:autotransporter-associated beta strand repeat-containing protein [Planctomycetia bacterium]
MQQIALVFPRFASPSRHVIAGLLIAVAMAQAASAQTTATWYGSGSSSPAGGAGTWNTALTNWTNDGTSWFPWNNTTSNTSTAVFAGTSGTVTLGTAITAGGLQFDTTGYTITSNTLTLDGAAPQLTVASTAIGTIASSLSGTGGITKAGAGTLRLSGSNTYSGATTITSGTLQIGAGGATGFINNSSPVNVASGAVFAFNRSDNLTFGGTVSGAGGFVKLGANSLTLTGSSSYTGGTRIDGGTVVMGVGATPGSMSALGTSTSSNVITINSGGTLTGGAMYNWLDSTSIASGGGDAHSLVINAGGSLLGVNGWLTGLGNVTLNGGSIQVSRGVSGGQYRGSFTLAGDITVSGSVASSITQASGANTTSNMLMSNGANGTGGTRTFTVNDVTNSSASDLIVSARMADGTVLKAGAGTLELAPGALGTSLGTLALSANWQVNAGTLLTTTTNAIGTGTVTLASSGTFDLGGQSGVTVGRIVAAGSLLNSSTIAASTAGPVDLSGTNTAQIGGPGSLTLSGTVSNGGFTKVGSGTLSLSGTNTYAGTTRVNAGALNVTNA